MKGSTKSREEANSDFPILEGTVGFANESVQIRSDQAVASVGNPVQKHAVYAAAIDRSIPDDIRDATHTPHGAAMVIDAMLLSKDPVDFQAGLDLIKQRNDERSMEKIIDFQSRIQRLGPQVSPPPCGTRRPRTQISFPIGDESFFGKIGQTHQTGPQSHPL